MTSPQRSRQRVNQSIVLMNLRPIFHFLFLTAVCSKAFSAETLTAKKFADSAGILDKHATLSYLIFRDKVPGSAFLKPGQYAATDTQVEVAVADTLNDLKTGIGHEPPYKWQEIDKASPPKLSAKDVENAAPAWQKIEYITKAKELKDGAGYIGPIRIRKDSSETDKPLSEANGAKIGFTNNRLLPGNGAWNSEGAVIYPIVREWDLKGESASPNGSSLLAELAPAISWQLAETQEQTSKDIQDFKFSLPMTFSYVPPAVRNEGAFDPTAPHERRGMTIVSQIEPYYDTDFSFHQRIWGSSASIEYVGPLGPLYLGGFVGLWNTDTESTNIGALLMYRLRIKPMLDYSVTDRGGDHTSRQEGDDWFRLGGEASFDLRFGGKKNPLDVGVSYRFMETTRGHGGFSDLIKAHATWWVSQYIGLTLEYQKGQTPVSDKDIDLITLGLELKY